MSIFDDRDITDWDWGFFSQVEACVRDFMEQDYQFFSEAEFQHELGTYLRDNLPGMLKSSGAPGSWKSEEVYPTDDTAGNPTGKPAYPKIKVYYEYFVPGAAIGKPDKRIYVDLVVEYCDDIFNEFVPIELKFKTKDDGSRFPVFDTNQYQQQWFNHQPSADNRFAFWKDVERIEHLKKTFSNIRHGIALFLSNEPGFWKNTGKFSDISLKDDGTPKQPNPFTRNNVTINIRNPYTTPWHDTGMTCSKSKFRYLVLTI